MTATSIERLKKLAFALEVMERDVQELDNSVWAVVDALDGVSEAAGRKAQLEKLDDMLDEAMHSIHAACTVLGDAADYWEDCK